MSNKKEGKVVIDVTDRYSLLYDKDSQTIFISDESTSYSVNIDKLGDELFKNE